jgi:hypothetical protein
MERLELLLYLAGFVISVLLIYAFTLRLKLWFIRRAVSILTSWMTPERNQRSFGRDVSTGSDIGGMLLTFIWIFNIVGLLWLFTHSF